MPPLSRGEQEKRIGKKQVCTAVHLFGLRGALLDQMDAFFQSNTQWWGKWRSTALKWCETFAFYDRRFRFPALVIA